jgi:subtilisin
MRKDVGALALYTGAGVRVAVLDSGVNPSSPALSGKEFEVHDCSATLEGLSVRKLPPGLASDRNGHGTIVHGCVLACAPDARVDHFRILDEDNQCDSSLLCYVLDHVLEQGYDVVNLSLGTRSEDAIPWLVSIMKRAYEQGTVVVASASNIGNSLFPARFTYCVSVEAALLAGPLDLRFLPRSVVEFAGFGVDVPVDVGSRRAAPEDESAGRKRVTGSSYAAAHVAGMCARIRELHPRASPLDVKIILRDYALSLAQDAAG